MADGSAVDSYFAAAPLREIGGLLSKRLKVARDDDTKAMVRERVEKWRQAYRHYYGFDLDATGSTSQVTRGGEQGEKSVVRINRARAVAKALLGLLVSQRLTWRPYARNGDAAARSVVAAATTTLEYLWKTERLQRVVRHWTEKAIIAGDALCFPEFDETMGEESASDEAGSIFTGGLRFNLIPPWNYRLEEDAKTFEDSPWVAIGIQRNKWDMLALHPRDAEGNDARNAILTHWQPFLDDAELTRSSSDMTTVVHFWHKRTPAVPDGLHVVMAGQNCVLKYEKLEVDDSGPVWPVVRLAIDEQHETPHSYSSWWDCLGVQEVLDGTDSAAASNMLTFGTQSIILDEAQKGKPLSRLQGMKAFWMKPGGVKPEPLQLVSFPKEFFPYREALKADQKDLVGLNDVSMGQPQTAQMNAAAFALLASMAQQRNAPQMQEVVDATGELGALTLRLLSKHWPPQKKLAVAGQDAEPRYETVDSAKLAQVERVVVEVGNPMEQTAAGRVQIAQLLASTPPEFRTQVQQIVETGRIEPMTDPLRAADLYIKHENEELRSAKPAQAHWSDDHFAHVRAHKSVLDAPDTRLDPGATQAVSAHMAEHYALYWGTPPNTDPMADVQWPVRIRMMLGQQAPPMAPSGPGGPGGPPPPGGPGGPPPLDAGPPGAPGKDMPNTAPPMPGGGPPVG